MPNQYSYWEKEIFFNYDVVITGSGIVGLTAAIHLKKALPRLNIVIIERGFLPSGASTKNAGFACFGSVSELIEQEETSGTDVLANIIERRWKGLLKLRNLLGDDRIDYQCLGGYELFTKEDEILYTNCVVKIEHLNRLIKSIVGPDAFSMSAPSIKAFGFEKVENLIFNQYEAQIDTGKMIFNLIKYAQEIGIGILNTCEVIGIENHSGLTVITKQGNFKCSKVILATNAFIKNLYPEVNVFPGRGQVLITKPIRNLNVKGTFHYDKGFYYFRNINQRILFGGGRNLDFKAEETLAFGQTKLVQDKLESILKEIILPYTAYEIDYSWSGIMAFGNQVEPHVAEIEPDVFCATRCNGMGIAIGSQTGEDVAEMVIKSL